MSVEVKVPRLAEVDLGSGAGRVAQGRWRAGPCRRADRHARDRQGGGRDRGAATPACCARRARPATRSGRRRARPDRARERRHQAERRRRARPRRRPPRGRGAPPLRHPRRRHPRARRARPHPRRRAPPPRAPRSAPAATVEPTTLSPAVQPAGRGARARVPARSSRADAAAACSRRTCCATSSGASPVVRARARSAEPSAPAPARVPAALRTGRRAGPGDRRGRGRARRADEPHPPAHRRAAGPGPARRGDPDHVQRDRHERGDGAARPPQGGLRAASRRQARVHELLRPRVAFTRSPRSRSSTPRFAAPTSSTAAASTWGSPWAPSAAWWCRWSATPHRLELRRDRARDRAARRRARATARSRFDELIGGTFTISNGGVYGSLLSTPILNPPQSGILGMHKIEKRPIAADDQVVMRPMMYVALSYDHRIVDGEQAVTLPGAREGAPRGPRAHAARPVIRTHP